MTSSGVIMPRSPWLASPDARRRPACRSRECGGNLGGRYGRFSHAGDDQAARAARIISIAATKLGLGPERVIDVRKPPNTPLASVSSVRSGPIQSADARADFRRFVNVA